MGLVGLLLLDLFEMAVFLQNRFSLVFSKDPFVFLCQDYWHFREVDLVGSVFLTQWSRVIVVLGVSIRSVVVLVGEDIYS